MKGGGDGFTGVSNIVAIHMGGKDEVWMKTDRFELRRQEEVPVPDLLHVECFCSAPNDSMWQTSFTNDSKALLRSTFFPSDVGQLPSCASYILLLKLTLYPCFRK